MAPFGGPPALSCLVMGPYDVDRLNDCLDQTLAWATLSNPSRFADNGAHDGYRQTKQLAAFGWVLADFTPVHSAWLSWIEPGGYVVPHVDGGPYRERWQIPIRPSGTMEVNGTAVVQAAGVPFEVEHWLPHRVDNTGDTPRVHLVVDRAIVVNPETVPFETL